jgi:outer membrane protein insertion porin family
VDAVETKVSRRVLRRYVPVFQQRAVDNDLLVEGRRNLTSYFQSKGYYDVEVDIRTSQPEPDLEKIEYAISRGQRYKLERISFSGATYFDEYTLRERMFLQPATFLMRHGRYSDVFRRKDEDAIATLYRTNGFRDVKVTSTVERNLGGDAEKVAVNFHIDAGPQWLVDHVALEGFTLFSREELAGRIASAAGQPFSEVNMASDRNALLTMYFERGYPSAELKTAWAPAAQPNHVSVTYAITEGDPQFIRRTLVSGLRTTRPSLVSKYTNLKPGEPLSPVAIRDVQKRLYDLGVFARVDTAVQNPDGETSHRYVLYNFEEARRYTLNVGVGAQVGRFGSPSSSSLGSPSGSTGFSPEVSADLSRINFLGIGHSIALRGAYSSLDKHASLNYLVPRFRDINGRNLTFTALYEKALNVLTFASRREEFTTRISQNFSRTVTGSVRFAYRRVSVSDVVIPSLLIPQLAQPVRLGLLGATFEQDRRDDKANPHRGIFNTADVQVAERYLGGQRNFARLLLRNATYHSLRRNLVLARQTQFGVIKPFASPAGFSPQELVPLPERFFAGGADSLRAFPYNQAGPRDTGAPLSPGAPASQPTGFPLGGNALFINNVELRFPLLGPNIQGVVFHDMGNVFSGVSDISLRVRQRNAQDFNYTVHDAGFGIRYRTPVGPVRVDLAYSINPPSFVGFSGTPQELLQCNPNLPPTGVCVGVPQRVSHFQFFFSIGQTF